MIAKDDDEHDKLYRIEALGISLSVCILHVLAGCNIMN